MSWNRIPAVAYYRMSTDKQETSIGFQKTQVEARFKDRYQVVEEYLDEGKSGSKNTKKRTGFLGMIEDLCHGKHKGKVKVVLCLDLSRFGRLDTITGAEYKKSLRRAGVRLETVNEGIIDWSTMTGRIMDSVLSESHNAFALLVGKKGLEGRIAKTKAGQFNGGSVPYGCFKHVMDDQGNELVIKRTNKFAKPKSWKGVLIPGDTEEVEAIRWLYEQFDVRDVSFRQLAIEAQEKGFPSPTGSGWRGQFVQATLGNHAYVGDAAIGKKSDGASSGTTRARSSPLMTCRASPAPTVHRNAYKALIARDLWDRVQAKIARRDIKPVEATRERRIRPHRRPSLRQLREVDVRPPRQERRGAVHLPERQQEPEPRVQVLAGTRTDPAALPHREVGRGHGRKGSGTSGCPAAIRLLARVHRLARYGDEAQPS